MTISTRTVIDRREIEADGSIGVRFAKQVLNGDAVLSSEWHRTVLTPGADVDAQLKAVSDHLISMGYTAIAAPDAAKIKATAAAEWTPEVLKACADAAKARAAELAAQVPAAADEGV